jgi:hypothetical protein
MMMLEQAQPRILTPSGTTRYFLAVFATEQNSHEVPVLTHDLMPRNGMRMLGQSSAVDNSGEPCESLMMQKASNR